MQFIAPMSIDETAHMLLSHGQAIPILADTVVDITKTDWAGSQADFKVQRRWKSRGNWFTYTILELKGTLSFKSPQETRIEAKTEFGGMAYLAILAAVILIGAGLSDKNGQIYVLAGFLIAFLLAFDVFVIYRVVQSLKMGKRS